MIFVLREGTAPLVLLTVEEHDLSSKFYSKLVWEIVHENSLNQFWVTAFPRPWPHRHFAPDLSTMTVVSTDTINIDN